MSSTVGDLAFWKDAVSIGKDFVLVIIGGLTFSVARKGLNTWERQLKGTADYELAKRLAKQARVVVAHLQSARSPLIYGWEFPEGYRAQMASLRGRESADDRAAAHHYVYRERMRPVVEALREFEMAAIEAEAVWGPEVEPAALALRQVVRKVDVMIDALISDMASGGQDFKVDPAFGRQARSAVSATPDAKDNEVNQEIKAAIAAIDGLAKPHLTRR